MCCCFFVSDISWHIPCFVYMFWMKLFGLDRKTRVLLKYYNVWVSIFNSRIFAGEMHSVLRSKLQELEAIQSLCVLPMSFQGIWLFEERLSVCLGAESPKVRVIDSFLPYLLASLRQHVWYVLFNLCSNVPHAEDAYIHSIKQAIITHENYHFQNRKPTLNHMLGAFVVNYDFWF